MNHNYPRGTLIFIIAGHSPLFRARLQNNILRFYLKYSLKGVIFILRYTDSG